MKHKLWLLGVALSLLWVQSSCLQPDDPVDRLVIYLETCLKILEKNKENAPVAGAALYKYRLEREEEINNLLNQVKDSNPAEDPELASRAAEKLAPLAERMRTLLHENPTLYLNEYITRTFEGFDLGF